MKSILPESLSGQMSEIERQKLFEWVYNSQPLVAVEVGGGIGGGSTFQIAEALATLKDEGKCKASVFLTADPINHEAQDFYLSCDRYKNFMKFFSYSSAFRFVFNKDFPPPDFIFFDGPDEASFNLNEFKYFDELAESGCKFVCHDWETGVRHFDSHVCEKAELLRPYLESLDTWETVEYLSGMHGEWPNDEDRAFSVGLICMVKK
jgi:hypothetical protein